jgi:hypothetical protein
MATSDVDTNIDSSVHTNGEEEEDDRIPYCYWLCGHKAEVILIFSNIVVGSVGTIDVPLCKQCYKVCDLSQVFNADTHRIGFESS